MKTCLNIGPRYYKDNSSTGGIVVLFENWIDFCDTESIEYDIIDTNKGNYINILWAYISILYQFFYKIFRCNIIFFNGTANDYLYIAPIVVFVGKLFGKKVVLRKFAGNFDIIYSKYGKTKKKLTNYTLSHSDINFWETKHLVDFGLLFNKNSFWFPNVRNRLENPKDEHNYSKRFVFISQVRKEKGVDELTQAFDQLGDCYNLDIYGPLVECDYTADSLQSSNCQYKGALSPEMVCSIIKNYDYLILPSYREGYPGIIIESYSVGVPVISTKVGGIPEIVTDGYNGFLIDSKNVDQLIGAIRNLDNVDYKTLSKNAFSSFEAFDANIVNKKIISIIK